ncbi:preprotein translocase subunit SecG [Dysgonomonas hofstadii]|uniref:Protein-export membrane protein SecG n=1 Tax=Dysgonomonas hofstadii TaxID=637886 RepID=A0A840CQR2_9BACT|nr:preprotein translocase subunit SecG [Dysgonomonas hofstadii]MBB4037766.1 preprotein translocase subunit SecG [Dysgonomonas hofstadii]
MIALITVLIVIAAIALILIVLVQKSKGGGLSSGFSSANTVMGVRKTTDFLEKTTWGLAGFIMVMSIVCVMIAPKSSTTGAPAPTVGAPAPITPGAPDMSTPALPMPSSTPGTPAPAGEQPVTPPAN